MPRPFKAIHKLRPGVLHRDLPRQHRRVPARVEPCEDLVQRYASGLVLVDLCEGAETHLFPQRRQFSADAVQNGSVVDDPVPTCLQHLEDRLDVVLRQRETGAEEDLGECPPTDKAITRFVNMCKRTRQPPHARRPALLQLASNRTNGILKVVVAGVGLVEVGGLSVGRNRVDQLCVAHVAALERLKRPLQRHDLLCVEHGQCRRQRLPELVAVDAACGHGVHRAEGRLQTLQHLPAELGQLALDQLGVGVREDVGVGRHVVEGVQVRVHQHEDAPKAMQARPNVHVRLRIVLGAPGLLDLVLVHEPTACAAAVVDGGFEHGDVVGVEMVVDSEDSLLVEADSVVQLGDKAQHLALVLEAAHDVLSGRLFVEREEDVHDGVLLASDSIVRRNHHLNLRFLLRRQRDALELDAVLLLVPLAGEVVAVVDEQLAAEDADGVADAEVARLVEVAVVTGVGAPHLGQLHALEHGGPGVPAVVGRVGLQDLDGVVGKEVMKAESPLLKVPALAAIVPRSEEAQHLAIVAEELRNHLLVVHALAKARLHEALVVVDHAAAVLVALDLPGHVGRGGARRGRVGVLGQLFRAVHLDALETVELTGTRVAVCDAEDTAVDGKVDTDIQVRPSVEAPVPLGHAVSLEERPLRHSAVLFTRFRNLDGIVLEKVLDDAAPDAVGLDWGLLHRLLEEGLKREHLLVQ
mmetsp:Transcript_75554/g.177402  ORF Transcript_75554/g.177402 Transcript_75554/m.177402 type:complete len:694 (+) Transcript_75554:221-2302(+)